jgi:choline dehydrogenase-like flavoprotein
VYVVIVDGVEIPNGSRLTSDICIIGAGPAGLAAAERLAKYSRLEVALIESGDSSFRPEIQALAQGTVEGQPYFPLQETRIRRFGGTSWAWGGILSPLDPIDFEERDWIPHSGWPFPAHHLDRFMRDALELCGLGVQEAQPGGLREVDAETTTSAPH